VQAKLLPQQRFPVSDRPSEKPSVSSLVGVPLSKSFAVTMTLQVTLHTVHFLPWQSRDSLFRPSFFASDH